MLGKTAGTIKNEQSRAGPTIGGAESNCSLQKPAVLLCVLEQP